MPNNDAFISSVTPLGEKITKAFNSDIVGDIIFSDEEISKISSDIYNSYYYTHDRNQIFNWWFYKKLFVLIVLKSKKRKQYKDSEDTHFYESIFNEIFNDKNLVLENFGDFKSKIDELRPYNWLKDKNSHKRQFVQTFLFNAYAPLSCTQVFVDLVKDAYNKAITNNVGFFSDDYETSPEDYQIFVSKYAKRLKESRYEDEYVSLYDKSYKLNATYRNAFIHYPELMAKLISRTIGYFKKYQNYESFDDGTYYSSIVYDHLTYTREKLVKAPSKQVEVCKSITSWNPYFRLNGDYRYIELCFPLLKSQSLAQYDELELTLYLNGQKTPTHKTLYVAGEDYCLYLEQISFNISRYIVDDIDYKFRVLIKNGEEVIYDSKDLLYRKFMLFADTNSKENRRTYLDPNKFNNLMLLTSKTNLHEVTKHITQKPIASSFGPNFYNLSVENGDYISFDNHEINFIDLEAETDIQVIGYYLEDVVYLKNNQKISVYRKFESVSIQKTLEILESKFLEAKIEYYPLDRDERITFNLPINAADFESSNYIKINNTDCELFKNEGVFTVKLISNNINILSTVTFMLTKLSYEMERNIFNNGVVELTIIDANEEIKKYIKVSNEKYLYDYYNGQFIFFLPYFKFRFAGINEEKDVLHYLTSNKNKNIDNRCLFVPNEGNGDFYSYESSFIEIDTNFAEYELYVNNKLIEPDNGKYFVCKEMLDSFSDSEIKVKIKNNFYTLYRYFKSEQILGTEINIKYEDETLSYDINNFIGKTKPLFRIEIYDVDDYDKIFTVLDLKEQEQTGSIVLPDFKQGYYFYRIYLHDANNNDNNDELRLILDVQDSVPFGDEEVIRFVEGNLALYKLPNKGPKFHDTWIKGIGLKKYLETGTPVFSGFLYGSGFKKYPLYFIIDTKVLGAYKDPDCEHCLFYSVNDKKIILDRKCETDISLRSIYFREED